MGCSIYYFDISRLKTNVMNWNSKEEISLVLHYILYNRTYRTIEQIEKIEYRNRCFVHPVYCLNSEKNINFEDDWVETLFKFISFLFWKSTIDCKPMKAQRGHYMLDFKSILWATHCLQVQSVKCNHQYLMFQYWKKLCSGWD